MTTQEQIEVLKVKLDNLEVALQSEPWNNKFRQEFRSVQAKLNSLIAEEYTKGE